MGPSPLSSHKPPFLCGSAPKSHPWTRSPSLNLICFWNAQLLCSQEKSFLGIWKSAGALSRAETGLRDCLERPDPAGLRHPSPACPQGSQKLSSTVCLTGEHSDLQKGLKEKQEDRNLSSFLFLLCPTPCLLSLHVLTKPGKPWKLGWATGKEPGFIGLYLHPR